MWWQFFRTCALHGATKWTSSCLISRNETGIRTLSLYEGGCGVFCLRKGSWDQLKVKPNVPGSGTLLKPGKSLLVENEALLFTARGEGIKPTPRLKCFLIARTMN